MFKSLKITLIGGIIFSAFTCNATAVDTPLSVYKQALENDTELRAAWHSLLAKREKSNQSSGALLPSVVLSGKIARNDEDVTFDSGGTGSAGDTSFDSHDLTLTFKQPVYRRDLISNLDITAANTLLAETEFTTIRQNLTTRIIQRYIEILSAQDKLNFASAETRAIKEQLVYTEKRLDVGRSTSTDYHEAKAAYDLSTAEVIAAQDLLEDTFDALTEIIGEAPNTLATLKDTFIATAPQPENIDHWLDTAETSNPGIIAAKYQLEASMYEVEKYKSGHYPKLDLVARYSKQETGGRFGDSQTDDASIALQLEVPLYGGGQVSSKVRESINLADRSREMLLKTQNNVERETRKAYRNITTSIRRIDALKLAVESSEAALSSIKSGYKVGIRNGADVLDAQRELYKAQLEYSAARYAYIQNLLQLKNITGMLSIKDIEHIELWFN